MLEQKTSSLPYKVLSRKYRPGRFQDIVGQELFVKLISRALLTDKVGHSFLLTGMRGVGKTTSARVLSMALNCSTPLKGDFFEPCGQCVSCQNFLNDKHLDIIEIDAASHTGVDDVRQILESSHYQPMMGKYKIFIIDEVHMLSKSAFNALLKTLEDPPEKVKFIFATTEVKKIPLTILSRCLRFDLKCISTQKMTHHLGEVCTQEGLRAEKDALFLIAQVATGSLRDALSILEQTLILSSAAPTPHLKVSLVREVLGIVSPATFQNFFQALLKKDVQEALLKTHDFYLQGGDPLMFFDKFGQYLHALLCLKVHAESCLANFLEEEKIFSKKFCHTFL